MAKGKAASRSMDELSLDELFKYQEECLDRLAAAKDHVAIIQQEVNRRYGESAKRAFEQAGKDSGTMTLDLQDGLKAKVDVSKKVEWDTNKLLGVAQTMPWERVKELFKVVFAVPETVYKGLAGGNPELKAQIDEARTVKFGEPKIVLARDVK